MQNTLRFTTCHFTLLVILTAKHQCWSLFLIELQAFWLSTNTNYFYFPSFIFQLHFFIILTLFFITYFFYIYHYFNIVDKEGHTPPFSEFPPFLEIHDVPTFHRFIVKQKYWITFVTNLYIISTLKIP